MSTASNAVFLSYASEDAPAVQRIADALRAAGIEVWFDREELRGGDAWDRSIREQIHDCRLFVPVISAQTEAREEGYFRREWRLAVERAGDMAEKRAFLVPVVIDATSERTASVPDKFREVQWTRLPRGATSAPFVERIRRLLAPEASPARGTVAVAPPAAILSRTMRPLSASWRSRPAALVIGAVLLLALGYFAIDRLWIAKRSVTTPAVSTLAPTPHSIAVLPFADLSEKHDQGYLADGIAEETLNQLANIPGLTVIGRTSSFQLRDKALDAQSIGTALRVAYVLEGSVRRSGEHVRVTAQLIDTRDGTHRWSDTYDTKFDDVLSVQDAIATGLARALEVTVQNLATRRTPATPEAYDLYLKGLHALDAASEEGCQEAVGAFEKALEIDPKYAPAAVGVAAVNNYIGWNGWAEPRVAFTRAREAANRAIAIDPTNAAAHVELANVHMVYDWDWVASEQELAEATRLGAHDSAALVVAGQLAATQGDWDKATRLARQALAEDPLNPNAHMLLGWYIDSHSGKFREAESSIRRALQIDPNWGSARYFLAVTLLLQGRAEDTLVEAGKEKATDGQLEASAEAYHALHRTSDSNQFLQRAMEQNGHAWASGTARVYAFRGEHDKAMEWLERAYQNRDEDLYAIVGDPLLRSLARDPRYKAFLRKMNLPE